jgi:hypothetical protein
VIGVIGYRVEPGTQLLGACCERAARNAQNEVPPWCVAVDVPDQVSFDLSQLRRANPLVQPIRDVHTLGNASTCFEGQRRLHSHLPLDPTEPVLRDLPAGP